MYIFILILAASINFSTAVASIAVGVCFLITVYKILKFHIIPIPIRFTNIFLIYFFIEFIIAVLSVDPLISLREFIGEIHRCLPFFLVFLCTFNITDLKNILIIILISNIINDVAGIYQWFVLNIPRPCAFNHTATFFGSMLLIQFPIHLFIARLSIMPKVIRKLAWFACAMTIFSLAISLTRGAWVAFLIVAIIFIIFEMNRKAFMIFICSTIIFLTTSAILSPLFLKTLTTFTDPYYSSNTERVLMWQSSFEMFKNYPLHGVGQEMFKKFYNEKYISSEALDQPGKNGNEGHSHPHSNIFKILSEGGILGISAFIILHGYFFREFYLIYRKKKSKTGLTAFLILLGLQIEGLTDTNMNQVPIMREYWLVIGLLLKYKLMRHCNYNSKLKLNFDP